MDETEVVMTGYEMQIRPYPLGAHCEADYIQFVFVSKQEDCGIIIYNRDSGRRMKKIPFTPRERIGNVYFKNLTGMDPTRIAYQFYEGDRVVPDKRARMFVGGHTYGKERADEDLKAGFLVCDFDWAGDERPRIPYEDCICYCMHVRGFTRHSSSGVTNRGTFRGMTEKIPYLKDIGITTVELQPVYEFMEIPTEAERRELLPRGEISREELDQIIPPKLNYWGYKQGYYYVPKAAYAAGKDASLEFKEMVREFHRNGMEVVLQFYFPNGVKEREISEILHFWVLEYHVDGFHLMGERIPATLIARDDLLTDTKLWYYYFDTGAVYERQEYPPYRNLAAYGDECMCVLRKYLKGDENMLQSVLYQMRHMPEKEACIHYLTNYYGLTLADLVSYDRKHNEDNGEDNRDGNSANYSWNCGEEGRSRRKKIQRLRRQQMKNAMCLLLMGQATPLIFMGDEFGNSQRGNNNPYCQDNGVTWLDWRDLERNRDIHEFWKNLVELRKRHPILHRPRELRLMDSLSCGYPDLSYHGQNAWRPQLESYNRHVGIMYCGKYAVGADGREDDFFYLAMNMHWEPQWLGMPKLPRGFRWKLVMDTEEPRQGEEGKISEDQEGEGPLGETMQLIPPRTIKLFMSVPAEAENVGRKRKTGGIRGRNGRSN